MILSRLFAALLVLASVFVTLHAGYLIWHSRSQPRSRSGACFKPTVVPATWFGDCSRTCSLEQGERCR
jgi:hypothetical protein